MSNNLIEDRAFVNSIVGEGTRFNGELDLNGLLRIDGDFTGTIKTTGKVLVGKNGRAECTINASTVVVGGAVKGNIYSSERVIVLSSGMILGNIYTPRLIVEEGVILNGECIIDDDYRKTGKTDNTGGTEEESGGGMVKSSGSVIAETSTLQEEKAASESVVADPPAVNEEKASVNNYST